MNHHPQTGPEAVRRHILQNVQNIAPAPRRPDDLGRMAQHFEDLHRRVEAERRADRRLHAARIAARLIAFGVGAAIALLLGAWALHAVAIAVAIIGDPMGSAPY